MNNKPETAYRQGYLAAMTVKPKAVPEALTADESREWLEGYEHGLRASLDSRHLPGGRPTMTR